MGFETNKKLKETVKTLIVWISKADCHKKYKDGPKEKEKEETAKIKIKMAL